MSFDDEKIRQMYLAQPGDFYAEQMGAQGLRHWWFRKRQHITRRLVKKYWNGGLVLDLGCGNCVWNDEEIPTVGIEICDAMLRYNMRNISSFSPLKADISEGLPIKSNSIDMVVITEVLEHIPSYPYLIEEITRVLKTGAVVIGSVPYSKFPGFWRIAFTIWCIYKGLIEHNEYYLNMCGHQVNFNIKIVRQVFSKLNFLEDRTIGLLTIFFVARKA